MVFVNDKKYACESCIKGHRSSSCGHSDRPLFEIKKKGRPVSQCEKCRELRKTKRVHSKCDCSAEKDRSDLKLLSSKSKRYIPILPALPNGLKDVYAKKTGGPSVSIDPKNRVDTLLNPCHCKDVYKCKCRSAQTTFAHSGGLEALAKAAALCCSASENAEPAVGAPTVVLAGRSQGGTGSCCETPAVSDVTFPISPSLEEASSCCSSKPTSSKRRRRRSSASSQGAERSKRGPSLPPILNTPSIPFEQLPVYPTIPPLSTIASLAGTGCTCGFDCTCPGCVEHRGPDHASPAHDDCPDGCSTCVDHQQGLALPTATGYGSASVPFAADPFAEGSAGASFIDAFLARAAAALPPPPPLRASSSASAFDPMNVTTYPTSLFAGERARLDERGPAFGLVRLPKLECCAGKCGCPGDTCGCGTECNGCCSVHEEGGDREVGKSTDVRAVDERLALGSCCSGA